MRLITGSDVDLAATLAICGRMGNARRVLERLRDRYEDPEATPQTVFEYGLCRAVYLLNDPNDTDKGPHQAAAVQAFTRCLRLDPGWWLPRFLRIELTSVPVGAVPGAATEPPERDLDTLLAQQAGVTDPPPYFVAAHAALLRYRLRSRLESGDVERAVDEFTSVLPPGGVVRVPFRFPYLDLPFRESVLLLRHLGQHVAADTVKHTGLAVFAASRSLQVA